MKKSGIIGKILKLRLIYKLSTSYLIMVLIMILVGTIGLREIYNIGDLSVNMYKEKMMPLTKMENISRLMYQYRLLVFQHLGEEDPDKMKEIVIKSEAKNTEIQEALNQENLLTQEETLIVLKEQWLQFITSAQEIIVLSSEYEKESANEIAKTDNNDGFNKVNQTIETVITALKEDSEISYVQTKNIISSSLITMLIIMLAGILVALLLAITISRIVTKPLGGEPEDMAEITKGISIGDLDIQVDLGKKKPSGLLADMLNMREVLQRRVKLADAIADGNLTEEVILISEKDMLGSALQRMTNGLNHLLSEIVSNSRALNKSSEDLTRASAQMSELSHDVNIKTDTVSGAAHEISINISTMASSSEEMSANIKSISDRSSHMLENTEIMIKTVEDITNSIEDVALKSKKSAEITDNAKKMSGDATSEIQKLSQSASEIGEVTEIIKEISQQTNLLALNANIEAATAGDAGKGFAVVANEIKELAKQSSKAAQSIGTKITDVQEMTQGAVNKIEQVADIIGEISESSNAISELSNNQSNAAGNMSESVKETTNGFQDITNLIRELSNAAREIAAHSAELEKGSADISKNISEVNGAMDNSEKSVNTVKEESENLTDIASKQNELVKSFKLKK